MKWLIWNSSEETLTSFESCVKQGTWQLKIPSEESIDDEDDDLVDQASSYVDLLPSEDIDDYDWDYVWIDVGKYLKWV